MTPELKTVREKVNDLKTRFAVARENVRKGRLLLADAEDGLAAAETARDAVQLVGQAVQAKVHSRLAGVVSRCLSSVFDEPYEFKIVFEKKRQQTEARLVFVRDGLEVNPLDAAGGGVVDVAAFALRLACLMLKRPAVRRLLVMDEPFRFVSAGYRPRVRALLEDLSDRMGVQIVMVTHAAELVCGKVIDLGEK